MEWITIFMPLIQECIKNLSPEQARQRVRNPGPRATFRMFRELRKQGLSRSEAKQELEETLQELADAKDDDIDDIVAMAAEANAAAEAAATEAGEAA